MFVKQPSFSACPAAGKKKTSVAIASVLQLAALDFRRIQPERRRLGFDHVAHDQPIEVGEGAAFEPRVGRADGRILSHHEQALEAIRASIARVRRLAVGHVEPVAEVRVIPADAGQPAEAELVLWRRVVAVPRLEQRDGVVVEVCPPTRGRSMRADISVERGIVRAERRHGQVARQDVEERRDVGRALNRRMAAQREDAAAGTPDVTEQQLQDRCRPDDLHPGRVLREADGVADGAGALRSGRAAEGAGDAQERVAPARRTLLPPSPACSGRSGASGSERPSAGAEALDRGASSCSRRPMTVRCEYRSSLRVPAREETIELLGANVSCVDDRRRVGVGDDVVAELEAVRRERSSPSRLRKPCRCRRAAVPTCRPSPTCA